MSVMRVAGGTPAEPFGQSFAKGHRKTLAIGVGVAVLAHAAILYAVLQARGAPAVFEPVMDKPVVMDFPPIYRAPPPPPPKAVASAAKPTSTPTPTPTQPTVQTRPTALQGPISDLIANPLGALFPTGGTDPVAPSNPPATQPKADAVIHAADWARRPTGADMARFYPDRAQRLGIEGQTVLSCTVSLAGAAENCRVVRETPANMGFGDAALRLARSFRFKPMLVDSQPKADGPIQVPLSWKLQ